MPKLGSQTGEVIIVPATTLDAVIDSIDAPEWKTLVAVVRWTGCRIGEALLLKWSDILWEEGKIRIPSPKTERWGRSFRETPLWDELLPFLEDHRDNAGSDTYVVNGICGLPKSIRSEGERYGRNTGTQFKRLNEKAGVKPWKSLWKALRSSRENELELTKKYRAIAIRSWLGHSQAVADKHYLEVTEADFEVASGGGRIVGTKPVQHPASGEQVETVATKSSPLREVAGTRSWIQNSLAPPVGLERLMFCNLETMFCQSRGA